MKRKTFHQNTVMAHGVASGNTASLAELKRDSANKLPKWKGFYLPDFFSPDPATDRYLWTEEHFRWMGDCTYIRNHDRTLIGRRLKKYV